MKGTKNGKNCQDHMGWQNQWLLGARQEGGMDKGYVACFMVGWEKEEEATFPQSAIIRTLGQIYSQPRTASHRSQLS